MSVGKVWFRSANNTWCCLYHGKQKMLARGIENKDAALLAHAKLVVENDKKNSNTNEMSDDTACRLVIESWLQSQFTKVKKSTLSRSREFTNSFVKLHGDVPVRNLKNHHFSSWLVATTTWNDSTKNAAVKQLSAAFAWALREEYISRNPAVGVKKPRAKPRGPEAIISEEEFLTLLYSAPNYLRDMLQALAFTGCRPSELLSVTASNYDADMRCWRLGEHKTMETTGAKHIVLSQFIVEMTLRLSAIYPTGPIFRGSRGQPYLPRNITESLHRLCRKVGITRTITPYFFRHSFAFNLLMNDVSDSKVAALLGHTSTKYVSANYGHMQQRVAGLGDDLRRQVP